ncbi:hypothetical protein PENTCL1PPCAC_18834, partial [Pristionchus entomophagus]
PCETVLLANFFLRSTHMVDNVGRHMEQIRVREQKDQEGEARQMIERENGRFNIEGQPEERFTLQQLQGLNDLSKLETIGSGTFAEMVKKSVYTPRGIDVAVKIVRIFDRPGGKNEGRGDEDMVRETSNTRRAAHENVVWLYGFVVDKQACYMCMELMQANLDEVKKVVHGQSGLHVERRLGPEDREEFIGCVAVAVVDGLAFLRNNARVMHRDIKPNNIMINDRGQVKICDFGVSKRLQTVLSSTRANTAGIGCIRYMAPEQFSAEVRTVGYGHKAGVWSLAISLHEFATGRNAYEGVSDFLIADDVTTKDSPKLTRETGFGVDLRNFIDACLFKDESERASLRPDDGNCLQDKKFYKVHVNRGAEARKENVIDVLNMATTHLSTLRKGLDR